MVSPRPARTKAETEAHLERQRRLALADIDHGQIRVAAIDRALEAIRTGKGIDACELERARETDHELKDVAS